MTQTGGYSNAPDLDELTVVTRRTGTSGFFSQLDTRVVWSRENVPTNVVVPGVLDLSIGTFETCSGCVTLRDCSLSTGCSRSFLARQGRLVVQNASRQTPGSFVGTLEHVVFREWLLGTDTQVQGGACVYVPSVAINHTF